MFLSFLHLDSVGSIVFSDADAYFGRMKTSMWNIVPFLICQKEFHSPMSTEFLTTQLRYE